MEFQHTYKKLTLAQIHRWRNPTRWASPHFLQNINRIFSDPPQFLLKKYPGWVPNFFQ